MLALLVGTSPADEEPLGIGVATVPVEAGVSFGLFASLSDSDPVATVSLVENEEIRSISLSPSSPEWLQPETLWLDYSLLNFRVLRAIDEALEVVVNSETGRALWIKRKEALAIDFMSWEAYLTERATAIKRLEPGANPLRWEPDGEAAPFDGPECIHPVEVEGEWMRVEPSIICGEGEPPPSAEVEGKWIRWRDGSELMIRYFLTC